eukprot:Ihof_evm3s43 gene=Ihof_evmTU3s43
MHRCQDMATIANVGLNSNATPRQTEKLTSISQDMSRQMADHLYSVLLELVMALEIMALHMLPVLGPMLSFLLMSWLYSLYCFEYKWGSVQWPLDKKLDFIETRWPYFAGFGMPFACCTFFLPTFVNGAVFAILYPAYIIMAT